MTYSVTAERAERRKSKKCSIFDTIAEHGVSKDCSDVGDNNGVPVSDEPHSPRFRKEWNGFSKLVRSLTQ